MKQAFIYQDEKSNKFWTIDYSDLDMCVHYGKINTIGKYEIREYDSEDICNKEAQKLIASKLKKGYKEYLEFDFEQCIYCDNEEVGLHIKTSHPNFVSHFTDEFYYSCFDEEAPFGSDEGSDTLSEIREQLRKKSNFDFSTFPKKLIEVIWGMNYIPTDSLDKDTVINMAKEHEMDMQQSDMITYATAFGQIKTTGKLNADLKERALMSLKRNAIMYSEGEMTKIQQKMYDDLQRFPCRV